VSLPGVEGPKSSACNQLRGKALKVTPWGAHYRVAAACGESHLVAFITRPAFLGRKIAEGDEIVAAFEA